MTDAEPIAVLTQLTSDLLAQLIVAPGFAAVVRSTEVQAVLQRVLAAEGMVTVAVVGQVLVGYVTVHPIEPVTWEDHVYHRRWEMLPAARELGSIEVSRNWRGQRIAERLLQATFAAGRHDQQIVVSEELTWHWDLDALHLSKREYRAMLLRLMTKVGFQEFPTNEPNIALDPMNMLLARIGPRAPTDEVARFQALVWLDEPH